MKKRDGDPNPDNEDYTLFDVEAELKYDNVNPGTVTVEGFGFECWEFEMTRPRDFPIVVNRSVMPQVTAATLLRRLEELRIGPDRLGWNPEEDELDIKEFVGTLG